MSLSHETCDFAEPPQLPHGLLGIVIAENAIIGRKCVIQQHVTIGWSYEGAPTIGNNVYIGAGATIIGGIHIGNHVRIGANCVVTENVPDDTTVVMQKPRYITKDSAYLYSTF